MPGRPPDGDRPPQGRGSGAAAGYPKHHLLAVLDDPIAVARVLQELWELGVDDHEIQLGCGPGSAAALRESVGHGKLASLSAQLAGRLGLRDDELEAKARIEQAMEDGNVVVAVYAPSDTRKEDAIRLFRRFGASMILYCGAFAVEWVTPPPDC